MTLYPNSPLTNADAAEAAAAADQMETARQRARAALELDAGTPHLDKKLSDEQRVRMQELAGSSR